MHDTNAISWFAMITIFYYMQIKFPKESHFKKLKWNIKYDIHVCKMYKMHYVDKFSCTRMWKMHYTFNSNQSKCYKVAKACL